MSRRSTKEDKTEYQLAREKMNMTREGVEQLCPALSADRIAKIELGKSNIQPEDVMLMAECYRAPGLKNYFCSHDCVIGQEIMPEIHPKELTQIAIETLNALNKMNREKDRLLEIVEDGTVCPDEKEDFLVIKTTLEKIAISVKTLQLWIDDAIAQEKLPKDFLNE